MYQIVDVPAFLSALTILGTSAGSWGWIVPGLLVGLAFGAMPGMTITMAMAIVMPMSLHMEFLSGIVFLTSVYTGAGFGGSVPAILLNIPGTTASVATTFDGYPMAQRGLHNEALGYALFSSTLCGIFGYVLLLFVVKPMADIVLKVGPVEMFAVAVWGLLLLGSLGSTYVTRGLLAVAFGVLLGTVGMNTAGFVRGAMGIPELLDGISTVPAMLGLLAASQLLNMAGKDYIIQGESARKISLRRILSGCWGTFRYTGLMFRGSVIGIVIGALPGVGSSIANLLSYAEAKRSARDGGLSFGEGNPAGVIASESAVASGEGGSMATMLALGIPGGGATAILLAAFMMHNIVPGPAFIDQQKDMVYAIILNNIVQGVLLLFVGIAFIYAVSNVVRVRTRYMLPAILAVCCMGTYSIDGSAGGPITLFVFAVLGYVMVRFEYPVAATVVGLVLGRLLETEFLRTWQVSGGHPSYILERPGAIGILVCMVASLGLTAWGKRKAELAERRMAAELIAQAGQPADAAVGAATRP